MPLVAGGAFALDSPAQTPAIWGSDDEILWAEGEPLIIAGPQGVAKTTLAQRLALARIGIRNGKLLGHQVAVTSQRLLYIAADRPKQAQRSMGRMVDESDRLELDTMMSVWWGPLPFDLGKAPERFREWIVEQGEVGTVVIDSLKDVASGLSDDAVGGLVSRAFQYAIAADIELVVLHHQRKGQAENRKPKSLDDVYGSTWITAAAGSVILLWGRPGDPILELSHLKAPAVEVGPLQIALEAATGELTVDHGSDIFDLLRNAGAGLSAEEAARLLFGAAEPERAQIAKARRRLARLVERGLAHERAGEVLKGKGGIRQPSRYFATTAQEPG